MDYRGNMTETSTTPWTVRRLLEWTVDYFQRADSPSSRLDAEVLLAEALGCQRIMLYTRFDEVPPSDQLTRFREWVQRRAAGEPVAYLVEHREFYSLKFRVTPDVLIPRPETEHVVMAALERIGQLQDDPVRVIDVGTGSGCIAITLAKQLPTGRLQLAATDLSPEALEVARGNARDHQVDDVIRFFEGDLLEALPKGSQPVHVIVSNPPYVGRDEIATVADDVRQHEPDVALFAGPKGTEIIQRLIEQSASMLLPGGWLIFETSPINIDVCVELVARQGGFESVVVDKDFSGHPRVVIARRSQATG